MGNMNAKIHLEKEYKELMKESQKIYSTSKIVKDVAYKKKNRYSDINPMQLSMVTLDGKGFNGANYFNGNYILNSIGNVDFIATQGPLKETVEDFWETVMRNEVSMIIGGLGQRPAPNRRHLRKRQAECQMLRVLPPVPDE